MYMKQKLLLVVGGISYIGISAYSWYRYYKQENEFQLHLAEKEEFLKMHKCVVMYGKMRMSGWPAYPGRYSPDLANTRVLFEPIIYFIRTAERELKIAVMYISALPILEAVHDALKRGVKIKIIVSFETPLNLDLEKLSHLGAEIRYYVGTGIDSIMHYKYAVKDCDNGPGYALYGSLNWTASGFFENYENIMIIGSEVLVQAFKRNFNIAWDHLTNINETPKIRDQIIEARHTSQLLN